MVGVRWALYLQISVNSSALAVPWGDVVPAAQLVGQGVVHAQHGVGKRDTSKTRGVRHLDPGLRVLAPFL